MQNQSFSEEDRNLRNSYQRKRRAKQLHLVTPEERLANAKQHIVKPYNSCISFWKAGAKRRGILWELDTSYLLALCLNTEFCPILGLKLVYSCYNGNGVGNTNPARASLDRIDSSRGYTEDNIQIVSWAFNNIKQTLTEDQLLLYCKSIVNYMENK